MHAPTSVWHAWSLLCLGMMLTLPFFAWEKSPPIPSFTAEAIAAGLGLLACVPLVALAPRLALPRTALVFPAFAVLLVAQMLLGRIAFAQTGLLAMLYLAWAAALALLGTTLRRDLGLERIVTVLAWFLVFGSVFNAGIALAQQLGTDNTFWHTFGRYVLPPSPGERAWANLGQPNHLANYLSLGIAAVAFLFASRRMHLLVAAGIVALCLVVLQQTGTRAALLYLLAMLAAAGWAAWRAQPGGRRLLAFTAVSLAVYLLLPMAMHAFAPEAAGPVGALARWRGDALAQDLRGRMWSAAWHMFAEAPVLGQGLQGYSHRYFLLNPDLPPAPVRGLQENAHNLPLHVMAEFGIAGLLVLASAAIAWVARLRRVPPGPARWWLLALAAVLGIHSLLEYPLWYAFFLGPAALVLGLGEGATVEFHHPKAPMRRLGWYVLGALVLGGIALGQLVRDYRTLQSVLLTPQGGLAARSTAGDDVAGVLLDVHRASLLAPLVQLVLARSILIDPDRLEEKLLVNGRALRATPLEDVAYRQAMLLALSRDYPAARRVWRAAVASYPAAESGARRFLQDRVEAGLTQLAPLLELLPPTPGITIQQPILKE